MLVIVALIVPITQAKWNRVHNCEYSMANAVTDPSNSSLYSGFLNFNRNAEKPARESGDVTMMCYVISGTLEVTIHETTFVADRGCSFCIPKGNSYRFLNIGSGEAKIFFVNDRSAAKKKKTKASKENEEEMKVDE